MDARQRLFGGCKMVNGTVVITIIRNNKYMLKLDMCYIWMYLSVCVEYEICNVYWSWDGNVIWMPYFALNISSGPGTSQYVSPG